MREFYQDDYDNILRIDFELKGNVFTDLNPLQDLTQFSHATYLLITLGNSGINLSPLQYLNDRFMSL